MASEATVKVMIWLMNGEPDSILFIVIKKLLSLNTSLLLDQIVSFSPPYPIATGALVLLS